MKALITQQAQNFNGEIGLHMKSNFNRLLLREEKVFFNLYFHLLITEMVGEQSNAKADKLKSQGAVARLLAEEKKDIPWQSVIFAVP